MEQCRMHQHTKVSRGFSKKDWLEAALEMMGEGSLSDLTIEALAKRLGVAKSGFYWHFGTRSALLEDLLKYWAADLTENITENEALLSMEPKQRLRKAAEAILDNNLARHDMAVRQWARKDKEAEKVVRKVTQSRLRFAGQALRELGFEGDDLDMRAMLFVCYHTWEATMFRELSRKRRRDLIARRIDLLTNREL
jgi:AcrR family transcriptional regulator